MRAVIAMCALLVSCHGTEFRVGGGKQFNDFKGSDSSTSKHGSAHELRFDQDDSYSMWGEFAFQLTPQSVVLQNPPSSFFERERLYPFEFETDSVPVPGINLGPILTRLDRIETKIVAIEEETEEHITWGDIGMKGGTGVGGLSLAGIAYLLWRNNRKPKEGEA